MELVQSRVREGAQKGLNEVCFIKTYILGHLNQFHCKNLTPPATFIKLSKEESLLTKFQTNVNNPTIGEISGRLKCTIRKAYFKHSGQWKRRNY